MRRNPLVDVPHVPTSQVGRLSHRIVEHVPTMSGGCYGMHVISVLLTACPSHTRRCQQNGAASWTQHHHWCQHTPWVAPDAAISAAPALLRPLLPLRRNNPFHSQLQLHHRLHRQGGSPGGAMMTSCRALGHNLTALQPSILSDNMPPQRCSLSPRSSCSSTRAAILMTGGSPNGSINSSHSRHSSSASKVQALAIPVPQLLPTRAAYAACLLPPAQPLPQLPPHHQWPQSPPHQHPRAQ